ncbi:MAG: hypothetical protein NTZ14_12100 [Hyphomicrobiales bacterium]|nr:hypothetical protein [Hyphomicrobiales bacterium]
MRDRAILACLAAALGPLASPLCADEVQFGGNLEGQGWRALTFRSQCPMSFSPEGAGQLNISGEKAVSVIWRASERSSGHDALHAGA